MSGPGDSLLLRAGLVRPEQLAEAQKMRARAGGTTGEWLVRLGAVSEEALVDFYHRRVMVPLLDAAQLARVPPQILAAVPAEMATEFLVFPVAIDDQGALTLAMADPADSHAAEEVAFYAGRACLRAVAPASALREAIERSYRARGQLAAGAAREPVPSDEPGADRGDPGRERWSITPPLPQPVLARPEPGRTTPASLRPVSKPPAVDGDRAGSPEEPLLLTRPRSEAPTPPLGLVVPGAAATSPPAPASGSWPKVAPPASTGPRGDDPPSGRPRSITQSRVPVPPSLRPNALATEPPLPPLPRGAPPPRRRTQDGSRHRTLPGIPVAPDVPLSRLRSAQDRDEVAEALLGYGEQLAPVVALLVVRRGALVGHDGRGPNVALERLRGLAIPLEEPSLIAEVLRNQLPFHGALPDSAIHRALYAALGRLSGDVLLLPISVSGKAVALLYAAGIGAPLPDRALRELAEEAGAAYERLIRSRKG